MKSFIRPIAVGAAAAVIAISSGGAAFANTAAAPAASSSVAATCFGGCGSDDDTSGSSKSKVINKITDAIQFKKDKINEVIQWKKNKIQDAKDKYGKKPQPTAPQPTAEPSDPSVPDGAAVEAEEVNVEAEAEAQPVAEAEEAAAPQPVTEEAAAPANTQKAVAKQKTAKGFFTCEWGPLASLGGALTYTHWTAEMLVDTVGLQPVLGIVDKPIIHPLLWTPLSKMTGCPVNSHPPQLAG